MLFYQRVSGLGHLINDRPAGDEVASGEADVTRAVIVVEINDGHTPVRLESPLRVPEVGAPVFQVVVGVAREDHVPIVGGPEGCAVAA